VTPAEQEIFTGLLLRLCRGVAARLGHDPGDPAVDLAVTEELRTGYDWLVTEQIELKEAGG
jgi:hypothetical protein